MTTPWRERPIYSADKHAINVPEPRESFWEENKKAIKLGCSLAFTLCFLVVGGSSCVQSTIRYRNRTRALEYVMPDKNSERKFILKDDEQAIIKRDDSFFWEVSVDYRNVKYYTSWGKGAKLDGIGIQGEDGRYIPKNKIANYKIWQRRFEDLLLKLKAKDIEPESRAVAGYNSPVSSQ